MFDGLGTAFFAPSGYYTLDEPGLTFSTSLYGLGEVGYTRAQYAQTVNLAANHSIDVVTPWIALGCGMQPTFHLQGFSMESVCLLAIYFATSAIKFFSEF